MTEHKPAEINQDALRAALTWALDEIDALSNKLVQFGYPQGILMLDREDQAEGYWNACDARRALDEWRCPKCGVQADERWNCCEVHPEAALPQEGAAVAPVVWVIPRARPDEDGFILAMVQRNCEFREPLYTAPSPAAGVDAVQAPSVEEVADAIAAADVGYSLRLTRLVDGESTYTLTYEGEAGALEFSSSDEAYEHIRDRKRKAQARAAIAAILRSIPPCP